MAPVIAAHMPVLKRWTTPLDFGLSRGGFRIFGDHKTWRGLICGIIAATVTLWLETRLASYLPYFPPQLVRAGWLLGPLLGFGAIAGDAVKSFIKRRRGFRSGDNWFLADQLDSIIGAILVSLLVVRLSWLVYLIALIGWPLLDLAVSYAGHRAGIKERFL